ncbi:MAG: hypothetical protein AB1606_07500 [Nitrospirota bacterium]
MDRKRENLKKFIKKFEDIMTASTFAEAGEFEIAKEILKENRGVLLAIRDGQIDRKTLKYAVNTCKRIGAHLDILYVSSAEAKDTMFERFLQELQNEDIHFTLIKKKGCLKKAIIDYTDERKEIAFVVVELSESLDIDCKDENERFSSLWQKLKCPLVVVTKGV